MVRDACLCFHVQQAARVLARYFDEAFRPLGLTNRQFTLMLSVNRREAPNLGSVAALLGMDHTTLTAAIKPLERRSLVAIKVDPSDKRSRRIALTPIGRHLLAEAMPIWKREHAALEKLLGNRGDRLRQELRALSSARMQSRKADIAPKRV